MGGLDTGWRLTGLALAWLAGVSWQLHEVALQPTSRYGAALLVGAAGLLLLYWHGTRRQAARRPGPPVHPAGQPPRRGTARLVSGLACLMVALWAWGATGLQASWRLAERLPAALEGRDLQLQGVVAGLPRHGASGLSFKFQVEDARLDGQAVSVPGLVSLGWYRGFDDDATLSPAQSELRAGQRWQFTVRLRQPHGQLNPHGFDHELRLFEQGLRATGYVRDGPMQRLAGNPAYPVDRARQWVRDAIDAVVTDRRSAGVLAALAVGDQAAIEREDWDLFRNTGVAHLVAISGLHITMFAWLAGRLVAALWRRSAAAMLWLPTPVAARWGGLFAAWAYAVFSGWGVPSQRTVWMLLVVGLLRTSSARWPWTVVMGLAAVVVTMRDPWALMQAGFWLSFVAVALLWASEPAWAPAPAAVAQPQRWRTAVVRLRTAMVGGLRTQWLMTLGLAPLSLMFFQQVSLVGLVANLMAIPLVTLLITPLALLGVVLPWLWLPGAWLVQQMSSGLAWLAALPGAVWTAPVAPAWAQWAGLLAAVLLVLPLPWRARALAVPLLLPLLLPARVLPAEAEFALTVVDVGQGTAVLVRTRHHLLLYDAGPQYSRDSDAGQRVLLPLLRARGEPRVDMLVLSHRDSDHIGGARAVLAGLPVAAALGSLEHSHPLRQAQPALQRCHDGQSWIWDGVRFEMLAPPAEHYQRTLKSNAMSCVLRVSARAAQDGDSGPRPPARRGRSVLLTGDIERDQELALVARHGEALRSDVLLVPHHGSRTSSTSALLDAVQPRWAVAQAGYRNRFGHPAEDVQARYRERGVTWRASPTCGAWTWHSDGAAPAGERGDGQCERDRSRRYWQHRADDGLPGAR